ncbi:MAG: V-type ATP synthase subunit D [Verrucomicrobia bacterium]|nr:V-type ATP synthase subunit D [Verrucomicrobiota bacterium]MDE3047044.1 V-type ATP synthase subunit D [Verrucomicrobiota bacterium]
MRLTKTELRSQQMRLMQFQRYLPTLQLKKAMLQFEVNLVQLEIEKLGCEMDSCRQQVEEFAPFLVEKVTVNLMEYAEVLHVKKHYENIAGVEIPIFQKVVFREPEYFLFETPPWTERAAELLQDLVVAREKIRIAEEKRRALEKELREVSIRVNLFEKVLIPRAQGNISKIKIFLGDQQLAAVAQAKVAKRKIFERKMSV